MSKEKEGQERKRGSLKRVMVCRYERERGKKRFHRSIAEKLRKYEVRAEGYEFIPAMMHLIKRYCEDVPENKMSKLDADIAKALNAIPTARKVLEAAVKKHEEIHRELKRRVFSPKYLDLQVEKAIEVEEMARVVHRARTVQNRTVRDITHAVAVGKIVGTLTPSVKEQECCCCCCKEPSEPPPSPQPNPTPPNKYEITFSNLYCVDESDPEWWGSDEPYVVFGVITEKMAESGTPAWGFHTPVYEDVDDGDRRPSSGDENLRLFGYTGPKEIDSSVLITAVCMENDLGDVSDTTDAVRTALTAVAKAGASAGGVAGWIVAGVSVLAIGVTYLIDLIGADDQIGSSIALSLTEAEADSRTSSVNPYIFPPLHFDGGDDDGIYDVYLKLERK